MRLGLLTTAIYGDLSGYFLVLDLEGSTFKHNYVKTNECRPILSVYQQQKCRSITLVSGDINRL